MNESSPPSKANKPAGFDQPTGPFARKPELPYTPDEDVPSFADDADESGYDTHHVPMTQAGHAAHTPYEQARAPEPGSAALKAELADMKEQALRAMAEVENIRRRSAKEREDTSRYAVSSFAKDLLDVADTFRRALESVPAELRESDPRIVALLDGIEATERKMLDMFSRNGIRKIEPLDEPFDPNYHEVMFETPVPGKPSGTIIQIIEPGYVLHDRLLRPARVGVSKDGEHAPIIDEEV